MLDPFYGGKGEDLVARGLDLVSGGDMALTTSGWWAQAWARACKCFFFVFLVDFPRALCPPA